MHGIKSFLLKHFKKLTTKNLFTYMALDFYIETFLKINLAKFYLRTWH